MNETVSQVKTPAAKKRATLSVAKRRHVWLGIGVSLISLVAIFQIVDPDQILPALRPARLESLVMGGVFMVAYMLLRAIRWRYLLGNSAPFPTVFHAQNIGYMLTQLLPFRLGDVARAVLIGQATTLSVSHGFSTMVVERLLDILLMVLLLPLVVTEMTAVPDWLQNTAQLSGALAGLGLLAFIILAGKQPLTRQIAARILRFLPIQNPSAWMDRLDKLLAGLNVLTRWQTGVTIAILSGLVWIPIILAYGQIMKAVHLQPTVTMAIFVMVVGAFSVAAPSSPGQIGVFHAGVAAAMTLLGQPAAQSVSLAILYHAINFSVMVFLGVIGLSFLRVDFSHIWAAHRT